MIDGTVERQTVGGVAASVVPRLLALIAKNFVPFLIRMQSHVKKTYLSGQPLKRRTGQLSESIHYRVDEQGLEVIGELFAGPETRDYAGVHERGGTFTIPQHTRLITMVWGRRLRTPVEATVTAHKATFEERAFLRPTLADFRERFKTDVVAKSVRQLAEAAR